MNDVLVERKRILKELDKRLNVEFEKEENKYKHIVYVRKLVLQKAKEEGLIKDYRMTTCFKYSNEFWGSFVGYDKMFKIIF